MAELLDSYPELIWETDEHNRSLFHIAVLHHDKRFFNLLHKFALFKDLMVSFKDEEGNNILHLAARLGPSQKLSTVSGPALQMQLELSWFKVNKNLLIPFFSSLILRYLISEITGSVLDPYQSIHTYINALYL